ncbi:hypothetical protein CYLTODRAFT_37943 [Cylindrobasidium torrendii FP15055 ss-10]|uniref:WD40 repeat-like protein n=1 Tax=Cylindrobasidium torrendii FP15055 ss-10 TaxID=1314674 RepID=A0A0D7BQH9_9AGAR|nr:hypothetical protein CYLTODRAFT_37943 [Cylindrobasidium torrendii FP15055 ss-10]
MVNLDLDESGEDAALTSDGATLALCTGKRVRNKTKAAETTGRGDSYVHLFDVARELRQSQSICTLERSKEGARVEVNRASFSPDGVYLAIARSDNSVHVYDARYMGRNVVHRYRHARPPAFEEQNHFGVVQLEWVHSTTRSAYNLLSGGEDGCVRMWTPGWTDSGNGRAIAKIDTDVGAFSVGDRNVGERDLVVGGSDGSVTVFDGLRDFIKVENDY